MLRKWSCWPWVWQGKLERLSIVLRTVGFYPKAWVPLKCFKEEIT